MATQIEASPEAVAYQASKPTPPSPTDLALQQNGLIDSLYQTILNRLPDPPGLAGWLSDLNSGVTPASVATQIEESPESLNDMATAGDVAFVNSLYMSFLGRTPDSPGLNGWLMDLSSGTTEAAVASGIYGSSEAVAYRANQTNPISESDGYNNALEAQRLATAGSLPTG